MIDLIQSCDMIDMLHSHLFSLQGVSSGAALDSARQNLAGSFVNAFVNAAFGADKLLTEDGNKWIYKNKEHGKKTSLAAICHLEYLIYLKKQYVFV